VPELSRAVRLSNSTGAHLAGLRSKLPHGAVLTMKLSVSVNSIELYRNTLQRPSVRL
jgi:hypothetical protein